MRYQVIIKPSAEKALDRLPRKDRARIVAALLELQNDPRPAGCVKLSGTDDLWRIRVGAYRIVYEIDDDRLIVYVLRVAQRGDVYRAM